MRSRYFLLLTAATLLLLALSVVHADEYDYARALIQSKISCSQLNESQLEEIGDYFMEQMHPGELHVIMEERLGGEGSESLRQAHINMGKVFYCGERGSMYSGMMNVMMGRSYGIGGGMMYGSQDYLPYSYNPWSVTSILINIFLVLLIIGVIIWIVRLSVKHRR
ncbi:hypothetical protein KW805_02525 [Candidatus Pacearchaeota archaeon]|nr:hypothetical protein [Candidatus Pacearchaeota archaeon]